MDNEHKVPAPKPVPTAEENAKESARLYVLRQLRRMDGFDSQDPGFCDETTLYFTKAQRDAMIVLLEAAK
jgi:hypothetical protein